MGQISFATSRPEAISSQMVEQCYFAGMEGIPWASFNDLDDDTLTIHRHMSDSGGLYIPWRLDAGGEIVLSTASLIERDEPYQLSVELARGTLNRLRNYFEVGRMLQYQLPPAIEQLIGQATSAMASAAIHQADIVAADAAAHAVIEQASQGIRQTCVDFARQLLAQRQRQQGLTTLWGIRIDETLVPAKTDLFLPASNAAAITFRWGSIEPNAGDYQWQATDDQLRYCREKGLKTFGGPLVKLQRDILPDWIYLWEDDFDNLRSFTRDFVDKAVRRYQGQVDVWYASAGLNTTKAIRLNEEQRLRLTLDCLESVRAADPRTPIVVSFSQPWAEYMAAEDSELSPLHFADYLVRSGVGVAAVGLEINWGYWPGGTLCRDLLEVSYHLDRWSCLGLPLIIFLTGPTAPLDGEPASAPARVVENHPGLLSDDTYYQDLLTVLLGKPAVQGVIWNQASDLGHGELPGGGVLDARGQPKPILETIANIRRTYQL